MPPRVSSLPPIRLVIFSLWALITIAALYLFIFHRADTQRALHDAMSTSFVAAGSIYLCLIIFRGLVLMPAAPLILIGVAFFPPLPLFLLTLMGSLIANAFVYMAPHKTRIDQSLSPKHAALFSQLRHPSVRHTLPYIITWSFLPFTPTLLLVYVCSLFKVSFTRTMLGVAIGSGASFAIYIFLGDHLLRWSGLKI